MSEVGERKRRRRKERIQTEIVFFRDKREDERKRSEVEKGVEMRNRRRELRERECESRHFLVQIRENPA